MTQVPPSLSIPHDDQMDVVRCFELEKFVKERPFEENPRRHWTEIMAGMKEELMSQMVQNEAIEQSVTKVTGKNEYRIYYKVHVMLRKKPAKE